jgi:hypothetical protein
VDGKRRKSPSTDASGEKRRRGSITSPIPGTLVTAGRACLAVSSHAGHVTIVETDRTIVADALDRRLPSMKSCRQA